MNWFCKISHGDCFRAATKWAADNEADVVHGLVTNAEGRRFYHAWAEKGGMVYDTTIDLMGTMTAQRYYAVVHAEIVDRYAGIDALAKCVREGNWGPWV
jgi:hypothetical protein